MAEKYYDIDDIDFGSPISVYVPLAILDLDSLVNRILPHYASRIFRFERCVDGSDIVFQMTHNSIGYLGLIRLSRLTEKETSMLISGVPPVTADEMFANEANKELYRDEGHAGFRRKKAGARAGILRMIFKGLNTHLEWIEPVPVKINFHDLPISDRKKEKEIIRQMADAGYTDSEIAREIGAKIGPTNKDAVKQTRLRMGIYKRPRKKTVP